MKRLIAILALASAFTHGDFALGQLTLLRTFSTEAIIPRGPDGIAYHPDEDELYAVDSSNATVYRLTTTGELLDSWASPVPAFYEGIAVLPDGDLVVADGQAAIEAVNCVVWPRRPWKLLVEERRLGQRAHATEGERS